MNGTFALVQLLTFIIHACTDKRGSACPPGNHIVAHRALVPVALCSPHFLAIAHSLQYFIPIISQYPVSPLSTYIPFTTSLHHRTKPCVVTSNCTSVLACLSCFRGLSCLKYGWNNERLITHNVELFPIRQPSPQYKSKATRTTHCFPTFSRSTEESDMSYMHTRMSRENQINSIITFLTALFGSGKCRNNYILGLVQVAVGMG